MLGIHERDIMLAIAPFDPTKSHLEIVAEAKRRRDEQRSLDLAEQRADRNSAEIRIRTWEKLHELHMPSDPAHPILDVIAVGTRLTLAEVQQEQRARAKRAGTDRREARSGL